MEENIRKKKEPRKNIELRRKLKPFLADTWWFAMTRRCSEEDFLKLVRRRSQQGFTAAQVVVGIPPEVGIYNENAFSEKGGAYTLEGRVNPEYLKVVRERIQLMNNYGLTGIIYGGWGYQVDWIGIRSMKDWWRAIIEAMDELDVIYCVTGESDMWSVPFMSKLLLPNRDSTQVHGQVNLKISLWDRALRKGYRFLSKIISPERWKTFSENYLKSRRRRRWSSVLKELSEQTDRPVFIHTTPEIEGFEAVNNTQYLVANTFQTGHRIESLGDVWGLPYHSKRRYPEVPTINLEPFYEGILGQFYMEDQLKGFWLSVAAGNDAICYGAHGIWNVGDGDFLSGWGGQTFEEALELETPNILGKSFKVLHEEDVFNWKVSDVKVEDGELQWITRSSEKGCKLTYIPNLELSKEKMPQGRYFDVYRGEFTLEHPSSGQLVIFH